MANIKCFLIEPVEGKERTWRRTDTGEEMILQHVSHAPVGAIWRASWLEYMPAFTGADGKSYYCKTPGGEWLIDGRASNCGLPQDSEHKCWCRHGEAPNFTVDKNGKTCQAGAGSIMIKNFHGFLRNGYLEGC